MGPGDAGEEEVGPHVTDVQTARRGGVLDVTIGNLSVAASVVVMLAVGPRSLGPEAFVGCALAWTATTVFGYGLAMPTEQLISRRVISSDHSQAQMAARRLVLIAAIASAATTAWAAWSPAARTYGLMLPAVLVGIWGWTLAAVVRGELAGRGNLRSYSWIFGLEACMRALLVAAAWLAPGDAPALLACSIGLPVLAASAAGLALSCRGRPTSESRRITLGDAVIGNRTAIEASSERREQFAFVIIAAGYQVCLNAAPIVLEWRLGATADAALIGAFVVANSYFRLASVLTGGFATPTLVRLSAAQARGDETAFGRDLRRALLGVTATAGLATITSIVMAPVVLSLVYGRSLLLAPIVSAALAVSTVAAAVAAVTGTALMAIGDAGAAARWWALGAVTLLVIVALDDHLSGLTAAGLVMGPAVTLGGMLHATRRRWRGPKPR